MMTHAEFARFAAVMAREANEWGFTALSAGDLSAPVTDENLVGFIRDQRERLNRMWCYGVQGEPVPPREGELGEPIDETRQSELHPGMWFGRCHRCNAHTLAARGVTLCDPCELANRAAIDARMAELDARLAEGSSPPLASLSRTGGT